MSDTVKWVRVAAVKDLGKGEVKGVSAAGRNIALYHLADDSWHATDNVCTHAFALLSDGWLEGNEIECPLHAGKFDVKTGKGLCAPIEADLATYQVRVDGKDVLVGVPA